MEFSFSLGRANRRTYYSDFVLLAGMKGSASCFQLFPHKRHTKITHGRDISNRSTFKSPKGPSPGSPTGAQIHRQLLIHETPHPTRSNRPVGVVTVDVRRRGVDHRGEKTIWIICPFTVDCPQLQPLSAWSAAVHPARRTS